MLMKPRHKHVPEKCWFCSGNTLEHVDSNVLLRLDTGQRPFLALAECTRCHYVLVAYWSCEQWYPRYRLEKWKQEDDPTGRQYDEELGNILATLGETPPIGGNINGEETMALYEIKHNGQTLYGHKLAVNSAGRWVMEVKNTGSVIAVAKEDVSEVLPYTVAIKFANSDTKHYHFWAKEGQVQEGDLFWVESSMNIGRVSKVNTKSKAATKWLKGWVIHGTYIKGEDEDATG